LAAALLLTACDAGDETGRPTVVASFFPLAEASREVLGDGWNVIDLTPPGVEPHDLELTAKQVDQIQDADYVVLLAGDFQPAVERAARRAKGKVVRIEWKGIEADPHVWLSPIAMAGIALQIDEAIGGDSIRFQDQLRALTNEYDLGLLQGCERRTLVTAHDAFGHMADAFSLDEYGITGISPEAEPNPQRLAELADLVRRTGTTTVFTEELASPRIAEALAREAGVKVDVLDTLESGQPGTYLQRMRDNLVKLRAALGCR